MRMEVHLSQRLEQRMHLSQQMLQNLELLQLPIMDLRELILQELEENPTLEELPPQEGQEPERSATEAEAEVRASEEETAKREQMEDIEEQWSESERRTRRTDSAEDAERRMEMMNNFCHESASLREHLMLQISLLELEPGIRPFCEHVIESVDDTGYIRVSLEDMVMSLPEKLRAEPPELLLRKIERAVTIVQSLEPKGVGARSVKECLLLQLDEANPEYPLLRKLIENHFEDVGANRLPRIVKAFLADPEIMNMLGHPDQPDPAQVLEDVKTLIGSIAKLNPRPGSTYASDKVPKVFPEVVIKQVDGKYEIVLEDGWLPPISVNRNYEEMLKDRKLTAPERERVGVMAKAESFPKEARDMFAELARGKRIMPGDRARITELLKTPAGTEDERRLLADISKEPTFNKDERDFMKRKVDAGRKLITAIEQRRGTIYRITNEILKRQIDFFEDGVEHLKPLKMQEVADALGIHLSTVSRAISEKWVETPRGVFPLKFFFASAAPKAEAAAPAPFGFVPTSSPGVLPPAGDGDAPDERTRLALMERIREIIDAEDKKNPLSDLEIVRILKDQHRITAARRTIAKYREEMNISSSRMRKQY
jgi:RNA polymerase sigma-54 factor